MKNGMSIITKQNNNNYCKTIRVALLLLFSLFMFQATYAGDHLLSEQTCFFWFSFFIAASILLREGLEAVLIIITILSLLKSLRLLLFYGKELKIVR